MKISKVVALFALVASATALKGSKKNPEAAHRFLKGDKDGGGSGLPDLGGACFSEVTTVQVQGKGIVAMNELAVGDAVLTQTGEYERVYAFGHHNPTKMTAFLQLETDSTSLEVTPDHLVFLQDKSNPIRADAVRVGDVLQSLEKNQEMTVTEISIVSRQGLYAPLTATGTVVVDGVVASSYISWNKDETEFVHVGATSTGMAQHKYVHLSLAPFRLLCQGVSASICEALNDEGMPYYVSFGIALNKWASSCNVVVHAMILALIVVLTGACAMLENTLGGASMAPLILGFMGVTYALIKATGITVRSNKCKTV